MPGGHAHRSEATAGFDARRFGGIVADSLVEVVGRHCEMAPCGRLMAEPQPMAVLRMVQAGLVCPNRVAVAAELQQDWRKPSASACFAFLRAFP